MTKIKSVLAAISIACFCPCGLLISGGFLAILKNKVGINLFDSPFAFQLTWSFVNLLILFAPFQMVNGLTRLNDRLSWLHLSYLGCGFLYYRGGDGPTEGLNRYIYLFLFAMASFVLEIYFARKVMKADGSENHKVGQI
jgi:hypothetical protein